jgi:hypothetical protein
MHLLKTIYASEVSVPEQHQVKAYAPHLIVIILIASLSYTLSSTTGNTALRIIYSLFMYGSILILVKVFFSIDNIDKLNHDLRYRTYVLILIFFALYNTIVDFSNPLFSWITLLNNPRALLSIVPIFGLVIGYNTSHLQSVNKVINVVILLFVLDASTVILTEPTTPKVFAGFVIPFVVLNLSLSRYKFLSLFVLIIASWNSVFVDYRALLLRIIFFSIFFLALHAFKRYSFIKIIIIVASFYLVYISLTDLSFFLELFQSQANLSATIGSDTRTFLYEELFDDLKPLEQVIGRGFQGAYFSPYFLHIYFSPQYGDGDYFERFSVEVGVLELILKGGYVFLIIYLAPIIYVVWKGLTTINSNFKLEYNICIYLLVELIVFFFENSPAYHIHFFLMFFFTGYVYNKLKTNEDINYNSLV